MAQVLVKARAVEQWGEEPGRLVAYKRYDDENLIHTAVDGKNLRGTLKHHRADGIGNLYISSSVDTITCFNISFIELSLPISRLMLDRVFFIGGWILSE